MNQSKQYYAKRALGVMITRGVESNHELQAVSNTLKILLEEEAINEQWIEIIQDLAEQFNIKEF